MSSIQCFNILYTELETTIVSFGETTKIIFKVGERARSYAPAYLNPKLFHGKHQVFFNSSKNCYGLNLIALFGTKKADQNTCLLESGRL